MPTWPKHTVPSRLTTLLLILWLTSCSSLSPPRLQQAEAPVLTPTLAPLSPAERDHVFDQVWTLVRDRYVDPDYGGLDWERVREEYAPRVAAATSPEAFYTLMQQVVQQLGDNHSFFLLPQAGADEQAGAENEQPFVGIGARLHVLEDGARILRTVPGAPAEEAGLRSRDLITAVDGVPVSELRPTGAQGVFQALRGPAGSMVVLTVRAPGEAEREVQVTRRAIDLTRLPLIRAERLPNTDVGVVVIDGFEQDQTATTIRASLEQVAQSGPLDGLIIDVRNNIGGPLDQVLETLALFLDGGTIGRNVGRVGEEALDVPSGQTMPEVSNVPIVVLTGPDTVSGGEMVAAGMQARGQAQVVGLPSAGNTKTVVGHDLPDGSKLWLAEYVYHLPDGSTIEGRGVQPDRRVDAEWWRFALADDPQIQAALELLQQEPP